jgi:hypothetical protein
MFGMKGKLADKQGQYSHRKVSGGSGMIWSRSDLLRLFSATTHDDNSPDGGQMLIPLGAVNIMRFSALP